MLHLLLKQNSCKFAKLMISLILHLLQLLPSITIITYITSIDVRLKVPWVLQTYRKFRLRLSNIRLQKKSKKFNLLKLLIEIIYNRILQQTIIFLSLRQCHMQEVQPKVLHIRKYSITYTRDLQPQAPFIFLRPTTKTNKVTNYVIIYKPKLKNNFKRISDSRLTKYL